MRAFLIFVLDLNLSILMHLVELKESLPDPLFFYLYIFIV